MKAGVGRYKGSSTPRSSGAASLSSSRSLRSHSDASLRAPSSAGTGIRLPTSVVGGSPVPPCCISRRPVGPGLPAALPPPGFLSNLHPESTLLFTPFTALPEEVAACLYPARAPPALRGGTALRPVQVLPCEAVACHQLIEPRSVPLGAASHRLVEPLLARHLIFLAGDSVTSPLPGLLPFLLRDLSLEVCEWPWERHWSGSPLQPFHAARFRLLCRKLRPLTGLLISGNAPVERSKGASTSIRIHRRQC